MLKRLLPIFFLVVLIFIGFGCMKSPKIDQKSVDRSAILFEAKQQGLIMDTGELERMKDPSNMKDDNKKQVVFDFAPYLAMDLTGWRAAALADVTGGQSFGLAHARFAKGTYTLVSVMGGLPTLGEGYFYEGWLIKRGSPFRVLSTGRVQLIEGKFVNIYSSKEDWSSFDFYALTLEPENNDPAANGEHILEGMIR
jgi:hypothetical protein